MVHAAVQRAMLTAHEAEPENPVRSIAVEVRLTPERVLGLHYSLEGDLTRLRVPQPRDGQRTDGLWQHTCFEAFITAPGASGYYEFNFSPSRDWAAYHFEEYRSGKSAPTLPRAPASEVSRGERLELTVSVALAGLARLQGAALRLALAAVCEAADGRLSYWALRHPPGKPDFHHPHGFVLELRTA
ncbi:MAG TPA: DOMON-like domain-containing protein [Steroidobacteraceae bacterium]|nr:DOMON-like domain-containing protein [Steroidobacteraceae bacterium]